MAAQDRAQPCVLLGYRAVHASPSLDPQLFQLADLPLDDVTRLDSASACDFAEQTFQVTFQFWRQQHVPRKRSLSLEELIELHVE